MPLPYWIANSIALRKLSGAKLPFYFTEESAGMLYFQHIYAIVLLSRPEKQAYDDQISMNMLCNYKCFILEALFCMFINFEQLLHCIYNFMVFPDNIIECKIQRSILITYLTDFFSNFLKVKKLNLRVCLLFAASIHERGSCQLLAMDLV